MQTIVRSEREVLLSYISDAHKDAYGYRPRDRYADYAAMSLEQLHAEADRLSAAVVDAIEEEDRARDHAEAQFELLIEQTIDSGAGNRETAIRWIIDSEGIAEDVDMQGMGYLCYRFGLRYSYFDKAN